MESFARHHVGNRWEQKLGRSESLCLERTSWITAMSNWSSHCPCYSCSSGFSISKSVQRLHLWSLYFAHKSSGTFSVFRFSILWSSWLVSRCGWLRRWVKPLWFGTRECSGSTFSTYLGVSFGNLCAWRSIFKKCHPSHGHHGVFDDRKRAFL